jgi:hypothetical protein
MPVSRRAYLALATAFLLWPASARAQETDPRSVEFKPSELHSSLAPGGAPYVSRYDLEFYYPEALEPFQVVNLGKPNPDPDGVVRAIFIGVPFSWPSSGLTYVARVAAVGPTGTGRSDASNTFVFSGSCHYVLSADAQNFTSTGGASAITVDTAPGCTWTASSSAPWAVITNATGSDSGVIVVDVRAGPPGTSREATITVAGQMLVLTQSDPVPTSSPQTAPHAITRGTVAPLSESHRHR